MSRATYAIAVLALTLSACATARMHNVAELNSVASACGLALGQLAQDEEAKRMVIVMQIQPTIEQQACVGRWARANHLRPMFIEGVEFGQ